MKRAQSASNSGALVIVITTLIVLYILFLPPADRAELLGEGSGGSGSSGGTGGSSSFRPLTLLSEKIGHVDYVGNDNVEIDVTSVQLGTSSAGSILQDVNSVYIKASTFDSSFKNVSFRTDELTTDVKLSFNVGELASGRLVVLLNGHRILNDVLAPQTSHFLTLPSDALERYNVITFAVSSPGWAFWQVNEYQLNTIQVTATVKDISNAQGKATFYVSGEDLDASKRILYKFYPDCQSDVDSRLSIELNNRAIFNGVPDCNVLNKVDLDPRSLYSGENELSFELDRGSVLITQGVVKLTLEQPSHPTYYFDINNKYFHADNSNEEICGEIDGVCPDNCEADEDKDCCFDDSNDNYWCDTRTAQLNDRCVSFVTESTCGRCDAGYEDDRGHIADACKETCGDDNDDECPIGCSVELDKDCCFGQGDNYWCDDLPWGRPLSAVCMGGVEPDERNYCPNRYYDDGGHRLSFTNTANDNYNDQTLISSYDVELEMRFPNNDRKQAILLINGREVGLDTYDVTFTKDISDYVVDGSNSIVIQPDRAFDVTAMRIRLLHN